jgi:hypothetical protein
LISAQAREKAESAKAYIERKYAQQKNQDEKRKEAWEILLHVMEKQNLKPIE